MRHQLFTRLLSDLHGVQARGGCACAGSYAHRLLGLGRNASQDVLDAILAHAETEKPGWVRLNLSALMSDEKASLVIDAVDSLARNATDYVGDYVADHAHARFHPKAGEKGQRAANSVAP